MELFRSKFLSSFSFSAITWNANMLWRVVLLGVFVGVLFLGAIATLSYLWATKVDTAVITTKNDKDLLSPDEIRTVVEVYKAKQERFRDVLTHAPEAPKLTKDSGIIAPPVEFAPEIPSETVSDVLP